MAYRYEYQFFWLGRFKSPLAINPGTFLELKKAPKLDLDLIPDDTIIHQTARIAYDLVTVTSVTKGTEGPENEMFVTEPCTRTESEDYFDDQINEQNIIFARGILAILTGSQKRIVYTPDHRFPQHTD